MKITNQTESRTNRNLYTVEAMLLRYGLALIFLWIGGMKFTAYEAQGIRPLAENSPLMSWLLATFRRKIHFFKKPPREAAARELQEDAKAPAEGLLRRAES